MRTLKERDKMIEITKRRAGRCEHHQERPAEYQITGDPGEYDKQGGPHALCQGCMLGLAEGSDVIRAVLLLQSATRT